MNNNHFDIEIRRPGQAEIAARAYELYIQNGRREGRAQADWLQAETELLQLAMSRPVESPATDKKPAKARTTVTQSREVSVVLPKQVATGRMKRIKLA